MFCRVLHYSRREEPLSFGTLSEQRDKGHSGGVRQTRSVTSSIFKGCSRTVFRLRPVGTLRAGMLRGYAATQKCGTPTRSENGAASQMSAAVGVPRSRGVSGSCTPFNSYSTDTPHKCGTPTRPDSKWPTGLRQRWSPAFTRSGCIAVRKRAAHLRPSARPEPVEGAGTQFPCRAEARGKLVLEGGLEPPHPFGHQILSLACLPIPPPEQDGEANGGNRWRKMQAVVFGGILRRQETEVRRQNTNIPSQIRISPSFTRGRGRPRLLKF